MGVSRIICKNDWFEISIDSDEGEHALSFGTGFTRYDRPSLNSEIKVKLDDLKEIRDRITQSINEIEQENSLSDKEDIF